MTDEELLEWYKNNDRTKPTGMSEQDYELNKNKALKLQQDQVLKNNFLTQQNNIASAQTAAQQGASISNEKLMKYLGQKQISNGVASGQTGSDFINANNAYVQNRANITQNATMQQNNLLNEYASNKLANEENAYNNEINIIDKYRNRAIQDEELQAEREKRQREAEQWQIEIDAYKQELQNQMEDRNTAKEDKIKAEQEAQDMEWLESANERINKMYSVLMDADGTVSNEAKQKIEAEIEKYKDKFNSDKNYNKLLDLYRTMVYDGK